MSNVDFLRSMYEAFGRGDVPAVLGMMDDDIEWSEAEGNPYQPSGKAWVGPDAVLQNLFVKLGADWDGSTVHPATFHDAGDTIVVEGRYTATHRTTGKRLDAQFCHVVAFRDGKVTRYQQFTDTAQLQDAMAP